MKRFLHDHSLSLTLIAIFSIQFLVALFAGWHDWIADQTTHGEPIDLSEFRRWFIYEVMMSTLADTYGMILIVLLTKRLVEKGSAESKE